jgi:hypothetical protein
MLLNQRGFQRLRPPFATIVAINVIVGRRDAMGAKCHSRLSSGIGELDYYDQEGDADAMEKADMEFCSVSACDAISLAIEVSCCAAVALRCVT